jgi:hypothetical protein
MGDIKTHFSNTGMFQYLAVLYRESKAKKARNELMDDWEKKALSARNTLVSKVGQIVGSIPSSGWKLGIEKEPSQANPILIRNIEYLIGAIWFVDHRAEFRKLTHEKELLAKTLEIFEQMLNLILEPGFGDNVGIQYTEIGSKCAVEFDLGSDQSLKPVKEISLESFMRPKSTPQVPTGKYKVTDARLIPALMAYEAVAENRSMRVRRGADGNVESDYLKFKKAIDAIKKSIAGETECDRSKLEALSRFADTVMNESPESVLALANWGLLTAAASAHSAQVKSD